MEHKNFQTKKRACSQRQMYTEHKCIQRERETERKRQRRRETERGRGKTAPSIPDNLLGCLWLAVANATNSVLPQRLQPDVGYSVL